MKLEFYLAFDSDGNFKTGDTEESAVENWLEEWDMVGALMTMKLDMTIERPIPVVLKAEIGKDINEVVMLRVGGQEFKS